MPLSAWFPRPVAVRVGDSFALASELRVRDLAALESYVAAALVSPLHGLDEAAEDYPDNLRAAYDLAAEWPPGVGSEAGQATLLKDAEGRATFLALALRETPVPARVPPIAAADYVRELAASVTIDQFADIERVAWAVQHNWRAAVIRAVDIHLGLPEFAARADSEGGDAITWSEAIGQLIVGDDKHTPLAWATIDAVGDLTLSQWRMVRSGGQVEQEGDPMPEDDSLVRVVDRARYSFFRNGKPMPEPGPNEPDPDDGLLAEPPKPEGWVDDADAGEWEAAV